MKYKIVEKNGNCGYQEYKDGQMRECGCISNIMAGKNYVCHNHLSFSLQSDRKPQVFNFTGREIALKQFKALCEDNKPKEEVKEDVKWI